MWREFISKVRSALESGFTLLSQKSHPHTIRLFRIVIYSWTLLNTLFMLPGAKHFWSAASYIPKRDAASIHGIEKAFNLLSLPQLESWYPVFIVIQIVFLVLGIMCVYPRWISLVIYFVSVNLGNKAFVILDGGDNLIQLMWVYLIFMDPEKHSADASDSFFNQLNNGLSNVAFLMARIQLVLVYLVAGLAKVTGPLWENGTALYYTLNVDEYTHPLAKRVISSYAVFTVIGTYATLLYQVSFPWLVWNKRVRPYLLAFGTFIHLQISFVMGLLSFGFAIACSYTVFYPDERSRSILEFLARRVKWAKDVVTRIVRSKIPQQRESQPRTQPVENE